MADDTNKISYMRTLIFTVVSAIFSIILFSLLFIPATKDFAHQFLVFIVILEIGIFYIIGYCIYVIVNRDKLMERLRDPKNYTLKFDSCPDYYVLKHDSATDKDYCSNEHIVLNKSNPYEKVIMKIVDENSTLPSKHNLSYRVPGGAGGITVEPTPNDKFMINTFYDPLLKNNQERCSVIDEYTPERADGKFTGFKDVPWTSIKTRCSSLYGKY